MNIFNLLFILPNIIKIFPELKMLIPTRKELNMQRKPCKTDSDCPFPAMCCNYPTHQRECCTGFGHRIPTRSYQYNFI